MPRFRVGLLAVLLAVTLVIPGSTAAQTTTSTTFKGKAVVKTDNTEPYVVVNFTCKDGNQTGNWTFEVSSTVSFSGSLPSTTGCELTTTDGTTWSTPTGHPIGGTITINTTPTPTIATLSLILTNVRKGKTFIPNTNSCSVGSACVEASIVSGTTTLFDSTTAANAGIATLNLSVR